MLKDFEVLGISRVGQLARRDPAEMYDELCRRTGARHDICCLDVFRCAVEQARNPELEPEKTNWWYWSRLRKGERC
jgi:hypothetical protein